MYAGAYPTPETLDLILYQQLSTLQFHELERIGRRMIRRLDDFLLQRLMLSFEFRKMRLHGHDGMAPWTVEITPLTYSVCHDSHGKSIIASCAAQ